MEPFFSKTEIYFLPDEAAMTIKSMREFTTAYITNIFTEQPGAHIPPIFIGATKNKQMFIASMSSIMELPKDKFLSSALAIGKALVKQLDVNTCCFALESITVNVKEGSEEHQKIISGDILLKDHPNKEDKMICVYQRAGHYEVVHYDLNTVDNIKSLGKSMTLPDLPDNEGWNFFADQKVN